MDANIAYEINCKRCINNSYCKIEDHDMSDKSALCSIISKCLKIDKIPANKNIDHLIKKYGSYCHDFKECYEVTFKKCSE
jgi:ATP-dependent helicase YprA (DUF1998 family)